MNNRKEIHMERVLTQEERIRRAEEIYLKRRNSGQQYNTRTIKENVNTQQISKGKDLKLFKRIALQIVICLLLYCIFYLIYDTEYSFSDVTLSKTQEVLNYDINLEEMYKYINEEVMGFIKSKENIENNNAEQEAEENNQENVNDLGEEQNHSSEVLQENVTENITEEVNTVSTEPISELQQQPEQDDVIPVSAEPQYSLIVPVKGGYISSEFGERESTSKIVSTNHKGIDIAAGERNKHCCCHGW